MDELIRRVDVARPLLEKYREAKRQAERARKLRNLGSCLAFRSDMETLSACIQIAVEAPAMGEAGREILLDALEHYGERAQVDMMLEEMAELSKALLKLRRAQKFREPGQWLLMEDVAEEIADVQIVLDQMKMRYPMWDGFRRKKLQRRGAAGLRERLRLPQIKAPENEPMTPELGFGPADSLYKTRKIPGKPGICPAAGA